MDQLSKITRVISYLVVPLLFLPSVRRLVPELLPVALWASVLISWVLHKVLKIKSLLYELHVLFTIACAAVVLSTLAALSGAASLPALAAVVISSAVVLFMHYAEKSLEGLDESDYRHILWVSVHYLIFCCGSLLYAVTHIQSFVALIIAILYALITYSIALRSVSKPGLLLSYILAFAFFALPPLMTFTKIWSNDWFGLFNVISVVCLGVMVHFHSPFNRLLRIKLAGEAKQFLFFNGVVALSYLGVSNALFVDWSVATTICLLLHAVVILFLTLKPRMQFLLKLSLGLYAITALKLLLFDLNDFGALVRVAALMGIGVILMVAAFYYQKTAEKVRATEVTLSN